MNADLQALSDVRGWLTESLIAYLLWVERQEIEPPHYFPLRLRNRPEVLNAIWRRLQVRSHSERSVLITDGRSRGARLGKSGKGYDPRRSSEADDVRGESVIMTDETMAARYARAVITGEPGAGKTWLLRRIGWRTARAALQVLDTDRKAIVDEVVWPIRIRLPELARSPSVPIDRLLAAEVVRRAAQGMTFLRRRLVRAAASSVLAPGSKPGGKAVSGREAVSPLLESFAIEALGDGRAIALFDAWDEVPATLRAGLEIRLARLAQSLPSARLLVTTRDGGGLESAVLRPPAGLGEPVGDLELLALDPGQVDEFCAAWFMEFPPLRQPAVGLKRVMDRHPPMRALARNPLMLTFMARLAEESDDIPTRRVELYDRVLRGLLSTWPREDEKPPDGTPHIKPGWELEAHVSLLAHVAHTLLDGGQLNEVGEDHLCAIIEKCRKTIERPHLLPRGDAASLLEQWKASGLVVPTGGGEVLFLHRTFQEYLAGVAMVPAALVDPTNPPPVRAHAVTQAAEEISRRLGKSDEARGVWQEPIRLALGHLGLIRHRPEECGAVIRAVIEQALGPPGLAVAAMGEAVAEISSDPYERRGSVTAREGVTDVFRDAVVETVRAFMCNEPIGPAGVLPARLTPPDRGIEGAERSVWRQFWSFMARQPANASVTFRIAPTERAACADALARLGDPRFHGPERWGLPDDVACGWVTVPVDDLLGFVRVEPPQGGTFSMGSAKKPFYLARWPVTVRQFAQFVTEMPHATESSWRSLANRPMEVSWRDALAYCDWLTAQLQAHPDRLSERLQESLRAGWRVSLPTALQWHWAARGGPDRQTPDAAPNLSRTGAVGCFHDGVSWCGIEKMHFHFAEWSRSEEIRDAVELVGVGVLHPIEWRVRSRFSDRLLPSEHKYSVGFRVAVVP